MLDKIEEYMYICIEMYCTKLQKYIKVQQCTNCQHNGYADYHDCQNFNLQTDFMLFARRVREHTVKAFQQYHRNRERKYLERNGIY